MLILSNPVRRQMAASSTTPKYISGINHVCETRKRGDRFPDPARGDLYLKEVEMLMRVTTGCAAKIRCGVRRTSKGESKWRLVLNSIPSDTRVSPFVLCRWIAFGGKYRPGQRGITVIGHASNDASVPSTVLFWCHRLIMPVRFAVPGSNWPVWSGRTVRPIHLAELYVIAVPESTGAAATVAFDGNWRARRKPGTVNVTYRPNPRSGLRDQR